MVYKSYNAAVPWYEAIFKRKYVIQLIRIKNTFFMLMDKVMGATKHDNYTY